MSPQDTSPNQAITDLIKKQIAIFGPSITLAQVKNIKGLELDNDGVVVNITEKADFITKELVAAWQSLSPFLAKKIAEPSIQKTTPSFS